VAKELMLSK